MSTTAPKYVHPKHPLDRPVENAVVLFLEAVASNTNAFKALRDAAIPLDDRCTAIDSWLKDWHFTEADNQLLEMVETWVHSLLHWWHQHPEDAAGLKVDMGWWKPHPKTKSSHELRNPPVRFEVSQYDYTRESFDSFEARIRAGFERFIDEQREKWQADQKQYLLREKRQRKLRREYDRENVWAWLALYRVGGWSERDISEEYRVPRSTVKFALFQSSEAVALQWLVKR